MTTSKKHKNYRINLIAVRFLIFSVYVVIRQGEFMRRIQLILFLLSFGILFRSGILNSAPQLKEEAAESGSNSECYQH